MARKCAIMWRSAGVGCQLMWEGKTLSSDWPALEARWLCTLHAVSYIHTSTSYVRYILRSGSVPASTTATFPAICISIDISVIHCEIAVGEASRSKPRMWK
ncbi:hypothetical protein J6590_009360 [Homalodisca vitripennis]|nr:hypothetical protein J6590_009360 [Homalodisca vitripennis]